MSSYLPAFLNAAILSVPLCAAIGLGLRFTPRRVLNAATRHHVLWALLVLVVMLPAAWLPRPAGHRAQPVSPQRAGTSVTSGAGAMPQPDNLPVVRTHATPASRPLFPIALPSVQWTSAILILWAAASLALLLRLGWSWIAIERYKARALPASADLEHTAKQWLARCGSSRKISLRITEIGLAGPIVAGPWRPSILLPAILLKEVSSEEMDRIGLHEAAHLARFDDYALAIQRVLEAIFFFHPAVRWIARQIDLEREIACDDCVVQITGAPRLYADSLARVAEFSAGMRHSNTAAAAGYEGSHLATRVEMLLARGRHTSARLLRIPLIAAVVTILLLAATASESPLLFTFMTPARVFAQAPPTAPPAVPKPATVPAAFSPAAPTPAFAAPKHEANAKLLTPKEESLNAEIAHNPRFTTVSITPVQWKFGAVSTNTAPGRIDYRTMAIKRLFFLAWPDLAYYRFVWPDGAIPPGGGWYDISVTMPENTTPEQLQRMTQALLADYF
ncbi:MAG TPA: M56 family metallopeptidase, partial [Bryobacteraceae bacterium]|nr:M56 family metallopeptidase [Bryobacteraceae bacterium]